MKKNLKPTLFIIDDEADVLITVKAWGEKKGYKITTFLNTDGFLDKLMGIRPQVVFIDIKLQGDDGRHICEDLKNILPFPIVIILISADPMALLDYHAHYADGILNKPFTFADLEKELQQHLKR